MGCYRPFTACKTIGTRMPKVLPKFAAVRNWGKSREIRTDAEFKPTYSPTPHYVLRKRHTNEIRRRVLAVHCVFQPNTKNVYVCSLVSVIKMN